MHNIIPGDVRTVNVAEPEEEDQNIIDNIVAHGQHIFGPPPRGESLHFFLFGTDELGFTVKPNAQPYISDIRSMPEINLKEATALDLEAVLAGRSPIATRID
jgi:hypothetical protein